MESELRTAHIIELQNLVSDFKHCWLYHQKYLKYAFMITICLMIKLLIIIINWNIFLIAETNPFVSCGWPFPVNSNMFWVYISANGTQCTKYCNWDLKYLSLWLTLVPYSSGARKTCWLSISDNYRSSGDRFQTVRLTSPFPWIINICYIFITHCIHPQNVINNQNLWLLCLTFEWGRFSVILYLQVIQKPFHLKLDNYNILLCF